MWPVAQTTRDDDWSGELKKVTPDSTLKILESAGAPSYLLSDTAGAMGQAAWWLAHIKGEGAVYAIGEVRQLWPEHQQIDRRLRDLRDYGWRIDEARSTLNSDLRPDERRLVHIGVAYWDPEARRVGKPEKISAKIRSQIFHRDGHACVRCGIASGEEFADMPGVTARMTAAHVYPDRLGGKATASDLITACQFCNEAIRDETPNYLDAAQVQLRVRSLGRSDLERLLNRMRTGRAEADKVDFVWRAYLQLPAVSREEILADLETELEESQ